MEKPRLDRTAILALAMPIVRSIGVWASVGLVLTWLVTWLCAICSPLQVQGRMTLVHRAAIIPGRVDGLHEIVDQGFGYVVRSGHSIVTIDRESGGAWTMTAPEPVIFSAAAGWPFPAAQWVNDPIAGRSLSWHHGVNPPAWLQHLGALESRRLPVTPLWVGLAGDVAIFGSTALATSLASQWIRRLLRMQRGACPACGYCLASAGGCPECGSGR